MSKTHVCASSQMKQGETSSWLSFIQETNKHGNSIQVEIHKKREKKKSHYTINSVFHISYSHSHYRQPNVIVCVRFGEHVNERRNRICVCVWVLVCRQTENNKQSCKTKREKEGECRVAGIENHFVLVIFQFWKANAILRYMWFQLMLLVVLLLYCFLLRESACRSCEWESKWVCCVCV